MGFHKNKKKKDPYILIEKRLIKSSIWVDVGHVGRDIYIELKCNYNGFNNGALICAYTYMRKKYGYGYSTISKAFKKLISLELIELAEMGELAGLFGVKANKYRLVGKHENILKGKR